jgi:threonine dehydrogenase-like Zn-dependent dehydrogenase
MRQVVMHSAGDVRVEEREEPKIIEPADAIVRLSATCICGSDLWPYRGVEPADHQVMGHEYVGVVEEIGSEVKTLKVGDFVVGSFVISDNTCELCVCLEGRCRRRLPLAGTVRLRPAGGARWCWRGRHTTVGRPCSEAEEHAP